MIRLSKSEQLPNNRDLDKGLEDLIRSRLIWSEKENLMRSVPGVGPLNRGNGAFRDRRKVGAATRVGGK